MNKIAISILLLLVSNLTYADAPEWHSCESENDCVVAEGSCGCPVAINKKYERFSHSLGKIRACTKPACIYSVEKLEHRALCKNNICVLANTRVQK